MTDAARDRREEFERMSDAERLTPLVTDAYRDEVRETSTGLGIVRRVTPAGKAVIDLDAGGSVALDPRQIRAVSEGGTRDG